MIIILAFESKDIGLMPFLTGVIISGLPITISSSNSGSAWDNSKKIIESNLFSKNQVILIMRSLSDLIRKNLVNQTRMN